MLLTIVSGDEQSKHQAYCTATEFLSALSWENNSRVKLRHLGGPSGHDKFQLKKAKCSSFSFPDIHFHPYKIGYDICVIPEIKTEEQRTALILFREALSSNNEYLSFLFYWQVLEAGGNDPIGWVNKVYRKKKNYNRLLISNKDLSYLPLKGKSLGEYLYDDCRNAIAHIKRSPGKVKLKLDSLEDDARMAMSTNIVQKLAKFYVEDKLKLNKKLNLVRTNGTGFPIFVKEDYRIKHFLPLAYKKLSIGEIRKKRWH